jgi:hypothetical protein
LAVLRAANFGTNSILPLSLSISLPLGKICFAKNETAYYFFLNLKIVKQCSTGDLPVSLQVKNVQIQHF